jgi:steroid delta-isomerase-like uncharacterized protein
MITEELQNAREAIVRAHTESENRHSFDETVGTFATPRYEVVPTGEVHEGADEVRRFLQETHAAFPDFVLEEHALHHASEAVFAEVEFVGTNLGPWRGLPATGKRVRYRMCNVFVFDGDRLRCERLYFDLMTALRQVGIARDPTSVAGRMETVLMHPFVIASALLRALCASAPLRLP